MRLGPAFRANRALARTVTFVDLILAAVLVFLVIPAALFATGLALIFLAGEIYFLRSLAEVLMGLGLIGTFAWVGAPVAVLVGWFATRSGWIGWAAAPLAGIVGAILLGVASMALEGDSILVNEASIILIFLPFGPVYGLLGWIALRYLRPDVYLGGASR